MNFNYIVKKLVRKNIKEYFLTIFGISFAVFIISLLGTVIFSPSVKNVFYPGGTSQQLSYSMYTLTMVSCMVFIIFIQGLFMRYKSKEIGVFMSLGVKKKDISLLIKKELFLIVPLGTIIGVFLSIPGAKILWYSLALFFDNEESNFQIGWDGVVVGVSFSIISYLIIRVITNRYLNKVDLIKLLKSTSEIEKVKFGSVVFGVLGFICIPVGLICMFIGSGTTHPIMKNFFTIGLVMDIMGIYLFSTQVSTVGLIVNKISKKKYFKNIVFFNLLKLKGKQFSISLFMGTILTAIGLYSLFYNVGPVIESFEKLENSKYDFGYLQVNNSKQLGEKNIKELAKKHNLNVLNYKELEGFFLTPYNLLTDLSDKWYWEADIPVVSKSSYNKFFQENIVVPKGKYIISVSYNKSTKNWNELQRPRYKKKFFTANKKEIKILPEKTVEIKNKMFESDIFKGVVRVLNDKDYKEIQKDIGIEYIFKYKSFNVDKENESINFSNNFFDEYLKVHNYKFSNYFSYRGSSQINKEEIKENTISNITPEIKRNWSLIPYSRIDKQLNGIDDAVVYFLVFGIISISCFIASGLIIGTKILSSMWEEKLLFKNISFLGCKKDYIKSIIRKQVILVYVFPNVLAAVIILSIYISNFKSYMIYEDKILLISYGITLIIVGLSIIISMTISRKIYRQCIKFIDV